MYLSGGCAGGGTAALSDRVQGAAKWANNTLNLKNPIFCTHKLSYRAK
jgi:hypothetical protein